MTCADFNDRLLLGLKGQMSEAELHMLAGRLQDVQAGRRGARRAAGPAAGRASSTTTTGRSVIDPDAEVAGRDR